MKRVLIGMIIIISGFFLLPTTSGAESLSESSQVNQEVTINTEQDNDPEEFENITPLSEASSEIIENNEFDDSIQGPVTRSATGYTYKNHTIVSSKTYTNKLLKTLKTSNLWSTAKNSLQPSISITVSTSNTINMSLSNGTNNFSISQNVSMTSSQHYTARPKARGYRVSIGLYAEKVVAKRIRISVYSNGSGKFSHYMYTNLTTFSGIYVGKSDKKG